jgi:hypothetical protein
MNIQEIENRFKEITGLEQDMTVYPITELVQFPIRKDLSKSHGEVFTPLTTVDHMIDLAKPEPDKYNMDLCAGRGQFTIRILRKFVQDNSDFDIDEYLQNRHWFNEFNPETCKELLYIFGDKINLAIGPAEQLKTGYPETDGIWHKGIYMYDNKKWVKSDKTLKTPNATKALF